jgi:hypothetical protein
VITGLILKLLADLASLVLGILPHVDVPSWLSNPSSAIGQVFQAAGSMGAWFPVTLASTVLLSVLAVWVAGFAIKVARIVVSFLTLGGGGAG